MQQNHCDGVLSNDWNTLSGQQISQHTAMSMPRSALVISTNLTHTRYKDPTLQPCRCNLKIFNLNWC